MDTDPRARLIYQPDGALDRTDFVEAPLLRGGRLTRYLLRMLTGTGGVVAGGYARWAASPRRDPGVADDVDVFCRDEAAFVRVRCALETFGHTLKKENLVSVLYREKNPWFGVACPPVNVVRPVMEGRVQTAGDLCEILHNFDFTVSKAGLLSDRLALTHHAFHEDEKHRRLRFTRIHTPVTGILRAIKYAKKGYKISTRELMRIFEFWDMQGKTYRKSLKAVVHMKPNSLIRVTSQPVPARSTEDEQFVRFDYESDLVPDERGIAHAECGYIEIDVDDDALDLVDAYRLMLIGPSRRKRGRPRKGL